MPLTPLHYVFAYALHRFDEKRLNLPALTVGSMAPDLEVIFLYFSNVLSQAGAHAHIRLFLHSILGAITLGTLISVIVTVMVYPPVMHRFLGIELTYIQRLCRFNRTTFLSCLLGAFTHVAIDATHHNYNPLLYPFSAASFDNLVLFEDWSSATVVVQAFLFAIFLLIFAMEIKRSKSGFWTRLLVGVSIITPSSVAPTPGLNP